MEEGKRAFMVGMALLTVDNFILFKGEGLLNTFGYEQCTYINILPFPLLQCTSLQYTELY